MKKAALVIGLLICVAAPLFAQGPFADVPTDHWAYEAVNQLQQDGILIGYPDGTFGGKRAMTRYEFAVAVARMIPIIQRGAGAGVNRDEFNALEKRVSTLESQKPQTIDTSNFATKADVDNLRKLVDEFRDELAALGVDVDALKRDVAALNDRVCALENEMRRVKWTGGVDAIFEGANVTTAAAAVDRDDRVSTNTDMVNNLAALENVDLNLLGTLTTTAAANVKIVGGNYLSWIGAVDDYNVFTRPDSKFTGLADEAALYYAYMDWALGNGKLSFGRQPIQWTPYTLRLIDVDSYTNIDYTDSGDYPMDAARINYRFGKTVKVDAFASKNNENRLLVNGLTSQPTSGLYNNVIAPADGAPLFGAPFNVLGGHAAGGLGFIDQSAGARLQIGGPFKGNIAGSWMQVAGPVTTTPGVGSFDSANIWGADLNFNLGAINLVGQWAMTDTLGVGASSDIDDDNQAIDGRLGVQFGKLGINAGWKRIERNFTAPGYWDKVGRWTNPSNVEGPYANLVFGITPSVSVVADAAFYSGVSDFGARTAVFSPFALPAAINNSDDDVLHVQGGLKWGLSSTNSVNLGVEWVQWNPSEAGNDTTDELYWNIGFGYQINPSAGFKLLYQIVDYKSGGGLAAPYGPTDYKENVAVAQFGVKF